MLTPISALTAQQAKPTQATMKRAQQFLDYAATQEPAVLTYRASDMILGIIMKKMPVAEQGGITFYLKMCPIQQTMEQFTMRHQ